MAQRMRSAALANTTAVFRPRHRGIDRVLRCAAKTNSPPSTEKHHILGNDLKGLVWDMDADTPLGGPLQNDRATPASVAERHIVVRLASLPLTLSAAIETAAAGP